MRLINVGAVACAVMSMVLAQDAREFSDAYQQGRKLSGKDASKIEAKLESKPGDVLDRVRLVAFYTVAPDAPVPEEAIKGRRRHLSWMAEHEPESWLWSQRSYGSAVYLKGDRLADPDGYNAIRDIWLKHLSRQPDNENIRANAASFLELADRETALRLTREMKNPRYLGTQYALLILGVSARDYDTGMPLACDASLRETPLAQKALAELQSSSDPQLIGGAGFWLARDGATLWTQGKLTWDYSSLAKDLLMRAQSLEPNRLDWFVANPDLPQPGELRAAGPLRIGGMVMESKRVHSVLPEVPAALRGIRGSVLLNVAIGVDGKVIRAVAASGPPELCAISIKAVEQWTYQPTKLNGSPVAVLTSVQINYK